MDFISLKSAIYNKVWHFPKHKVSSYLRAKCDRLPTNQRLLVVSILLGMLVLTAFVVFGHACYKIGLGHSRNNIEIEHIEAPNITSQMNPATEEIPAYDF